MEIYHIVLVGPDTWDRIGHICVVGWNPIAFEGEKRYGAVSGRSTGSNPAIHGSVSGSPHQMIRPTECSAQTSRQKHQHSFQNRRFTAYPAVQNESIEISRRDDSANGTTGLSWIGWPADPAASGCRKYPRNLACVAPYAFQRRLRLLLQHRTIAYGRNPPP